MLVSRDVILTYIIAKGMALSMSFFTPFFLLECREQMQNSISSEKVTGMDGEMFTDMSTDVRHIEIIGFFDAILGRRAMEGKLTGSAGSPFIITSGCMALKISCHCFNTNVITPFFHVSAASCHISSLTGKRTSPYRAAMSLRW